VSGERNGSSMSDEEWAVRLAVHASTCPVAPEDGRSVESSGVWRVIEVSPSAAAHGVQDARRRDLRVLTSCLRCGGWPADVGGSATLRRA
jgi:hypothetical protein